jgi:hypothetical protein
MPRPSSSTDSGGTVARYDWDFGDGNVRADGGAKLSHTYKAKGTYTVTVTETDDAGCSTAFVSAGHTAYCNGSASAKTSSSIDVARKLKLSVKGKKTQELGDPITVKASCGAACTVKATGTLKLAGTNAAKPIKLKKAKAKIKAGKKKVLKLKLSASARRAAAQASSGKATVKLTATAKPGQKAKAKRKVTLR